MKKFRSVVLISLGILLLAAEEEANAQRRGKAAPQVPTLSAFEASAILQMREEEKLARDVYLTLGNLWGTPPFVNIAESEQRHMDAVGQLIRTYGLPDPVVVDVLGTFATPKFQELYFALVALGSTDLHAAYEIGVTIEEMDIDDLVEALGIAKKPEVRRVFQNLLQGSLNHLEAFEGQL